MKLDHILVTTDLSEESNRAVVAMADLAKRKGARITLLHIVEDAPAIPRGAALAPPVPSPDIAPRVADARAALESQRALFDGASLNIEVIGSGQVAETITAYARDKGVDLIAMSTHGRSGFRRLALGSVTEQVIRQSAVPVLAFPATGG